MPNGRNHSTLPHIDGYMTVAEVANALNVATTTIHSYTVGRRSLNLPVSLRQWEDGRQIKYIKVADFETFKAQYDALKPTGGRAYLAKMRAANAAQEGK